MNSWAIIPLLGVLIHVFAWTYLFGQRHRSRLGMFGFLFSTFATIFWVGSDFVLFLPIAKGNETAILKFNIISIFLLMYLFTINTYKLVRRKYGIVFFIIVGISVIYVLLMVASDLVIRGSQIDSFGIGAVGGPLFLFAYVFPIPTGLWCAFLLWKIAEKKETSPKFRKTTFAILPGIFILLLIWLPIALILPALFGVTSVIRFVSTGLSSYLIALCVGVYRYHVMSNTVERIAEELFREVKEGVLITTPEGEIKRLNQMAKEILDVTLKETVGKSIQSLITLKEFGETQTGLVTIERGNLTKYYSINQSHIRRDNADVSIIYFLRDITDEKMIEIMLRRSHDELEKEIEGRTAELLQAQKLHVIGKLASGIAHDLNNLLTPILGFAASAREELPLNSPLRNDLKEVIHAGRRARDIVKKVLDFRPAEKPDAIPIELGKVIKEVISLIEVSLAKDIKIEYHCNSYNERIMADPDQMHQVFMNLITNACYAMKEKGGVLNIDVEPVILKEDALSFRIEEFNGEYIHVTVKDTGVGIKEEILDKIFDPFFTTKPRHEGTGLGLPTVLNIIKKHEGHIKVESKIGEGTAFHVYLPAITERVREVTETLGGIPEGNEKILFVDDEEQIGRLAKRMLQPLGYTVKTMMDSSRVLERFAENPDEFDLVITDQTMPHLTGIELAAELLKIRPKLPIILISGYAEKITSERIKNAGIRAFRAKPIDKYDMAVTIRRVLDDQNITSIPPAVYTTPH